MKKVFILMVLSGFILPLSACKKAEIFYYPLYQSINLVDQQGKYMNSINWGEKLIPLMQNDKEEKIKIPNYDSEFIKVKRVLDGSEGYVYEKYIIKELLSLGVILKETLIYDTPAITARTKNPIKTAVLAFVLEEKKNDSKENESKWLKIKCFNPNTDYQIEKMDPIYQERWVQASDLSLNEKDINMIAALQISLKNYRSARSLYEKDKSNTKNEKKLKETIEAEEAAIKNLISANSSSDAVKYAEQVITILSQPLEETIENTQTETTETTQSEENQ
ncbi:MAG: hypothetical protein A2Y41_08050 [Spirochaetes bacterium GWB1_36_13]|nr:MAG: hypothetical protein A2Y41_08050 [Spirochaetes bacterium GWB1_36_13]